MGLFAKCQIMEYVIEKLYGMYSIVLPHETGQGLMQKFGKRLLCTINGQTTIHSALMPIKSGGYYITIGKTYLKPLNATEGSVISVSFKKDASELQFKMPEELAAVLETDDEANAIFNKLTEGNKRSLAYLVTAVKNADARIKRALLIAEKIKQGITSARMIMSKT